MDQPLRVVAPARLMTTEPSPLYTDAIPGALLMRLLLAGWRGKADWREHVSQLMRKTEPLSVVRHPPLLIAYSPNDVTNEAI